MRVAVRSITSDNGHVAEGTPYTCSPFDSCVVQPVANNYKRNLKAFCFVKYVAVTVMANAEKRCKGKVTTSVRS